MSNVRRRVLRPPRNSSSTNARLQQRIQKKQDQLEKEQAALARWMSKLRRSFHAVEKQQARVSRLEKQLAELQRS